MQESRLYVQKSRERETPQEQSSSPAEYSPEYMAENEVSGSRQSELPEQNGRFPENSSEAQSREKRESGSVYGRRCLCPHSRGENFTLHLLSQAGIPPRDERLPESERVAGVV